MSSNFEKNGQLQAMLRSRCKSFHLADPEEFLLLGQRQHYNVFVIDALATGMRSFELCRRMRMGGQQVPIVAVWKNRSELDRSVTREFGVTDLISPPFEEKGVFKRILGALPRPAHLNPALEDSTRLGAPSEQPCSTGI